MKSLGVQVREFLEDRGWKPADLAAAIGDKVKRQHIEQLIANPDRLPHYIRRLAVVMGKSVGELLGEVPPKVEPVPLPEWSYEAGKLAKWLDQIRNEPQRLLAYAEAIVPILRAAQGLPPRPTPTQDAHATEEKPPDQHPVSQAPVRNRKRSDTGRRE